MESSYRSDSYSTFSNGVKFVSHTSWRFKWTSSRDFILGTLCYTVTPSAFKSLIVTERKSEPNIIQYIIVYVFVGLPIIYMQVFIGQYTQMGIMYFKNCLPVASGLPISFMINVILITIKYGFLLTDFLMYFMLSLQPQLPWMFCPKEWKDKCFTGLEGNNTREKFLEKSVFPSSYIYWRYIYMDDPVLDVKDVSYGLPNLQRIIALCMSWCITFAIVAVSYSNNRKVTQRLFYIYVIGLVIINFGVLFSPGGSGGIENLIEASFQDFLTYEKWSTSIKVTIESLALGHVYLIYAGAHLNHYDSAGILCAATLFFNTLLQFTASLLTSATVSVTHDQTNTKIFRLENYALEYETATYFIVIPQGLGYLGFPQMWSALYFGTVICLLLANQITHLITIEMTLMEIYPNFVKYRLYVLAVLCLFSAVVGFIIMPGVFYIITQQIIEDSLNDLENICTFFLCFFVFWVYGVTRLSDDIHFMSGNQPTKFWKICWYFSPSIIAVLIIQTVYSYINTSLELMLVSAGTAIIMLSPIIICAKLEFLKQVKKRRLIDLVRPVDLWGPPDPEERQMRQLFNPRTQNRFQKIKMECQHKCLIGSKVYKSVCAQENRLRMECIQSSKI